MKTWMIVLTIAIVVFFVVIVVIFYFRDKKKRGSSDYISRLIFKNYNKKIDSLSRSVDNENFTKLLSKYRLEMMHLEKPHENLIFENIKKIDALEDNFELLKKINPNRVEEGKGIISLLKSPIYLYELSEFCARPKNAKCKAIFAFEKQLKRVFLNDEQKRVLSCSPCFKFNYVFMFLSRCALLIDIENIFAVEMVDYSSIGVSVRFFKEEYVDFDGTYDLSETQHQPPKEEEIYEKVLEKRYVLSFSYKGMTYDIEKSALLLSEQAALDKLTMQKF